MKYAVLLPDKDETHVYISDIPDEIERNYKLKQGVRLGDTWRDDVTMRFSAHRPQGLHLTDYVDNSFSWLLVSPAFRQVSEQADTAALEYLPVRILNHKGRVASDQYYLANFTTLTEAIDRDHSDFREDRVREGKINKYERMALRAEVLENGPAMFRLAETPMLVLVREDLVAQMEAAGLTGMRFRDTDRYMTFDPFL